MIIFENEKMSISIENSDVVYVKFNENELKEDIYKIKGDSKNDVLDNVKKLIDYKPEWFVENPQIIISTDYDFDGNSNYEIVLKQSDIDNYSMHLKNNVSMKLYYDDNGYFYAIRYYINEEKEIADEFPIISLNKAILEARQGNMYNISGMELDTRNILKVELVYICPMPYEYYLPYYKFYMACLNEKDESNVEGCRNVGIAYVPAISSEYIESKEIVFQ